jgi:5-methylcytosine-specific restriction endonuclease McrA
VPRKVKEWVEYDHDKWPPPAEVQRRIIKRGDGKCVVCGRSFGPKLSPEFDHRPPVWEIPPNEPQRESRIFATCLECHQENTNQDSANRAAIKRQEKKKWGLDGKPKRKPFYLPKPKPKQGHWEPFTCPHTGVLKARWKAPGDADDNGH